MIMKVILRDLRVLDSEISWKWRNDPEVWKLTARTFTDYVSLEIEQDWIEKVIKRIDEKRFAICVGDDQKYVGNIQLTHIKNGKARFHIFIGDKQYWGKGIATNATQQILEYGFNSLKLKQIYLFVKKENVPAIRAYKKAGFSIIDEDNNEFTMEVSR